MKCISPFQFWRFSTVNKTCWHQEFLFRVFTAGKCLTKRLKDDTDVSRKLGLSIWNATKSLKERLIDFNGTLALQELFHWLENYVHCMFIFTLFWSSCFLRVFCFFANGPIKYEYVGFEGFESQGLRARLCCRKISDSIFWLHCFTPRWLAGAMPYPKKAPKEIYKKER